MRSGRVRATRGVTMKRDGETIEWTDVRVGDCAKVWTASTHVDDSCPSARRIEVE
jgi:hypothetical protein